jgi:hypothetical protein
MSVSVRHKSRLFVSTLPTYVCMYVCMYVHRNHNHKLTRPSNRNFVGNPFSKICSSDFKVFSSTQHEHFSRKSCYGAPQAGWPDWVNFCHLGNFSLIEFALPLFGLFYALKLNLTKDGLGYILGDFWGHWSIFFTKHLVTLASSHKRLDGFPFESFRCHLQNFAIDQIYFNHYSILCDSVSLTLLPWTTMYILHTVVGLLGQVIKKLCRVPC